MIYTLIVNSNHLTTGRNALQLAQDLLAQKQQINCIYFLFDGAYVANKFIDMPTDEFDLTKAWSEFAKQNNVPLSVCAASGLRRGIIQNNLAEGFYLGSIGELVESCAAADNVVTT